MFPQLIKSDAGVAGPSAVHSPPPRFRPLGTLSHVRLRTGAYVTASGTTEAQRNGLRYEAKVQEALRNLFTNYQPGPWFHFYSDGIQRQAQADGVLIFEDRIFVFEIKYGHTSEAWWQLCKLYKPLLEALYREPVSCVEICRSYDPSTSFPCATTSIVDLSEWIAKPRPEFGVLTWRL